jgi:hypothetical protein
MLCIGQPGKGKAMKRRWEDIMEKVASLVVTLLLGLGLTLDPLIAAQGQPDPNAKARKEYAVLDKALKANGLKAKADALRQFVRAHPDSQYKDYAQKQAIAAMEQLIVQLYQKKDMAALGGVSEEFLRMQPGNERGLGGALEAFYATKNYAKAAKYGEALYARKPSPGIAEALADCYDKLKDNSKFVNYAQKIVAGKSDKEAFPYNIKLFDHYTRRRSAGRAAGYAQKMLAAYGGSDLPPGFTEASWNQVKGQLYSTTGLNHFNRKRWRPALVAYRNSLRFKPRDTAAYYHMGMSHWNLKDNQPAIKDLAIAAQLEGSYASRAQKALEALYKGGNNGSLDGLDRIKEAAMADVK